ncbi:hypothetical protein AGLY_003535, partial [Aphis glycines]
TTAIFSVYLACVILPTILQKNKNYIFYEDLDLKVYFSYQPPADDGRHRCTTTAFGPIEPPALRTGPRFLGLFRCVHSNLIKETTNFAPTTCVQFISPHTVLIHIPDDVTRPGRSAVCVVHSKHGGVTGLKVVVVANFSQFSPAVECVIATQYIRASIAYSNTKSMQKEGIISLTWVFVIASDSEPLRFSLEICIFVLCDYYLASHPSVVMAK